MYTYIASAPTMKCSGGLVLWIVAIFSLFYGSQEVTAQGTVEEKPWICLAWPSSCSYILPHLFITANNFEVTALFATGGIRYQTFLFQRGEYVLVHISVVRDARWQIHELPVDFSVNPKLRCGPKHVGKALPYSGVSGESKYIYGKTTDLILHSLVVFVDEQPVTCGTIVPVTLPASVASIQFKSNLYGRIYIVQWPGERTSRHSQCMAVLYNYIQSCGIIL